MAVALVLVRSRAGPARARISWTAKPISGWPNIPIGLGSGRDARLGEQVASGIYFYRLVADSFVAARALGVGAWRAR